MNRKVIEKINNSGAQVVFVGLGSPFQEYWMINVKGKVNASVLLSLGAAFDIYSGRTRQAPAWMQNLGLEWLFRWSQEPFRLCRRYTITNLLFLFKILQQINSDLGLGRYSKS